MPWWSSTIQDWFGQAAENKVATWPLPSGARVGGRHIMVAGAPPCASRASRHMLSFNLTGGGERSYALIDCVYAGTPGELIGDTGEDPDGRIVELKITDHQIGNPHPEYSGAGVAYSWTMRLPNKTDWHTEWFYPTIQSGGDGPAPVSLRNVQGDQGTTLRTNDACSADNAWGNTVCTPWDWYTFSECAQPAGAEKVFAENFARFNGIDSYIALTSLVSAFNAPFVVTCDFRYQGQPDWMPIWGKHASGGFFGFDEHEVIFGNLRLNTSWVPEVNQWYHYEYRFEQSGQLGHQQLIDDVIVMDATTNRQSMNANRLGVYRHTVPGTIWGRFDLKFLQYLKGTPGDFDVQLDMPLQTDALDLGPNENHGTTFNMELPSV